MTCVKLVRKMMQNDGNPVRYFEFFSHSPSWLNKLELSNDRPCFALVNTSVLHLLCDYVIELAPSKPGIIAGICKTLPGYCAVVVDDDTYVLAETVACIFK